MKPDLLTNLPHVLMRRVPTKFRSALRKLALTLALSFAAFSLTGPVGATAQSEQPQTQAYTIPQSEIVTLPVSANGIAYQLYIHVPQQCRIAGASCPTIYMLDAEYSFALSAQIVTHLADRERITPLISVAIGYPDKAQYRLFRSRDYTPYFHPTGGYGAATQAVSGGGPAFLDVIASEIIPYVETHYPASSEQRALVGHSYGGLFATYAWLTRPVLFDKYIIVSPSLWYAEGRPLADVSEVCANDPTDAEADIFLAVGAYEEQPENGRAMVSDLDAFAGLLENCASRTVNVYARTYEDETHASIFPAAFSTGLRKHFQ